MTIPVKFSIEDIEAIDDLGGIEICKRITDQVLREHGIEKSLVSDNDVKVLLRRNIGFLNKSMEFSYNADWSIGTNVEDLIEQAKTIQEQSGDKNFVEAMLQHLVGAKLDIVLGTGKIQHHGFSVADLSTERNGDFQVDLVTFHVTTHPTEALMQKCTQNLRNGLKPVVVTIDEGVTGAKFLLKNSRVEERVDVLDAIQFLTANVYEHSVFQASHYKPTMTTLLQRYNEIVVNCETDPALTIAFTIP